MYKIFLWLLGRFSICKHRSSINTSNPSWTCTQLLCLLLWDTEFSWKARYLYSLMLFELKWTELGSVFSKLLILCRPEVKFMLSKSKLSDHTGDTSYYARLKVWISYYKFLTSYHTQIIQWDWPSCSMLALQVVRICSRILLTERSLFRSFVPNKFLLRAIILSCYSVGVE
jgi:hypothetical protein